MSAVNDLSPNEALRAAYLEACELELRAYKPGNVSVHSAGHGMTVEDFRKSAAASAPFLCDERLSLGEKIYFAIEATQAAVGCNTNLGIVLLAAPLIRAFETRAATETLRDSLRKILINSTILDADWVFRAIRLAQPGGLGEAPEQDVRAAPEVTLIEAMRLAERRDGIARQYTHGYTEVFDCAIPRYDCALSHWDIEEWAAVAVFVGLLKRMPDSHIERKFGTRHTRRVADRMAQIERVLFDSATPQQAVPLIREVDREFKSLGINPGTTADLTVACLLAVRLEMLLRRWGRRN
jgi:triphosphoribosyl-dephospho-CoA synthase